MNELVPLHGFDCKCGWGWDGMLCKARVDWFEGDDPTEKPPPTYMNRYQYDPDGMAKWAHERRNSIFPWIRRRAHHAIRYAIYNREIEIGWRNTSARQWVVR